MSGTNWRGPANPALIGGVVQKFDITAQGQVFYAAMYGREKMRCQLGSADGGAVSATAVAVDVDYSLRPYTGGRGTTLGQQIAPVSQNSDWVDTTVDITAIGAIVDITGPASVIRFTVTTLTGLVGNLQLWVV